MKIVALFLLLTTLAQTEGFLFSSSCEECIHPQLPNGVQCYAKRKVFGLDPYPDCPDKLGVQFYLYTSPAGNEKLIRADDINTISNGNFDGTKPVKFLIHGFTDYGPKAWSIDMKNEFLAIEPMNVIIVNWKPGAKGPNYFQAVANTKPVGDMIAKLIQVLVSDFGASYNLVHLIGHSLGAHVSGLAGKAVKSSGADRLLGRISGIDPAGLFFVSYGDDHTRLTPDDAAFVDVIHTTTQILGISKDCGNVDFYPNRGEPQPGCERVDLSVITLQITELPDRIKCGHAKGIFFYIDSISKCPKPTSGQCVMGYHANPSHCSGAIDLVTTQQPPYCEA